MGHGQTEPISRRCSACSAPIRPVTAATAVGVWRTHVLRRRGRERSRARRTPERSRGAAFVTFALPAGVTGPTPAHDRRELADMRRACRGPDADRCRRRDVARGLWHSRRGPLAVDGQIVPGLPSLAHPRRRAGTASHVISKSGAFGHPTCCAICSRRTHPHATRSSLLAPSRDHHGRSGRDRPGDHRQGLRRDCATRIAIRRARAAGASAAAPRCERAEARSAPASRFRRCGGRRRLAARSASCKRSEGEPRFLPGWSRRRWRPLRLSRDRARRAPGAGRADRRDRHRAAEQGGAQQGRLPLPRPHRDARAN